MLPALLTAAITVLVPSSMTDVLEEAARAWESEGHARPVLSTGSTAELARQALAGARADVFISADEDWMDRLERGGAIEAGTRVVIATNRLVCAVPKDGPAAPTAAAGLAAPGMKRIAIANETVPAGKYARAALADAEVLEALEARLVPMPNVRLTLALVERGEADAGLVYSTDAVASTRVRVAFEFAESSHPPIRYPAAVLRDAADPAGARSFIDFLRGERGRAALRKAGFRVPR